MCVQEQRHSKETREVRYATLGIKANVFVQRRSMKRSCIFFFFPTTDFLYDAYTVIYCDKALINLRPHAHISQRKALWSFHFFFVQQRVQRIWSGWSTCSPAAILTEAPRTKDVLLRRVQVAPLSALLCVWKLELPKVLGCRRRSVVGPVAGTLAKQLFTLGFG